jgi:hypothetical protein
MPNRKNKDRRKGKTTTKDHTFNVLASSLDNDLLDESYTIWPTLPLNKRDIFLREAIDEK